MAVTADTVANTQWTDTVVNTRGIVFAPHFGPFFLENTIPHGILSNIFENPRGISSDIT